MGLPLMMNKLYEAIERAVAQGVPPGQLAVFMVKQGWPPAMVNEAVNAWLLSHGRLVQKTEFKQWLKKYKRKALPYIFIISAISVLCSAVILLKPWPIKIMVDSVFGSVEAPGALAPYTGTPTLILITSLMTIIIFLIGAIFNTLRDYVNLNLSFRLNRSIKSETLKHILYLPLNHRERLPKGDYIYRQNNLTTSLSELVLDTTASIVQSLMMVAGILVIMFSFNPGLTLISIAVVPFLFLLVRLFGPSLGRISRAITKTASNVSSAIAESIDNTETIQSFNLEDKQLARSDKLWQESHALNKKGLLLSRLYRSTNSFLIILGTSAVMYLGGTAALNKEITLGELLIFMTYMGFLLGPIESLATLVATRNQKIIDVSRVYEVLSDHENIENLRKQNHFPISRGRIEFQNVSYNYDGSTVLKNINLVIESGQKVGIIGPSGGGKSTLLKLLPLFAEPSNGRVLIDNVDIQTVSLKELRQSVGWISQSPQLFQGTILENLLDGNIYRQISPDEIDSVVTAANAQEFIQQLPLQFDSPAGEGGSSLSGGQKQRIAIARGLLKNAPILCMDEPTAALDSKSENNIKNYIPNLMKDKTVILVTHRLALLGLMDVIYVLENGEIKSVDHYGGLEKYLNNILSTDGNMTQNRNIGSTKLDENEELVHQQQRMAELELENTKLQQKISSGNFQHSSDSTLHIEH